jgi:phasin
MHGQPRIAEALQLEFRTIHRDNLTARFCFSLADGWKNRRPNDDSLNRPLVSQVRRGRSTASPKYTRSKAAITLTCPIDQARFRVVPCKLRQRVEQAPKILEKFLASAREAAGSLQQRGATVRAGAKDISTKAFSYAENNVKESLDYAASLVKARDVSGVLRLQSEYVQGQMRALAEQAKEMGQTVSRAAMDAIKPKS